MGQTRHRRPPRPAAAEGTAAMTEGTADPNAVVHTAETHLGTILVDQEGFHAVRVPQRH